MDGAKPKSTRFWLCILGLLVVLAIIGLFALHAHRQTGAMVQVTQGGEVVPPVQKRDPPLRERRGL